MSTAADKSVITCDLEGVIDTYNAGAEKMFGYTREETLGKLRVSVFSPGEIVLQNLKTWLTSAVRDGEHVAETIFIRKSGERFPARIRISPTFREGKQIGFCGVTEELDAPIDVPIKGSTKAVRWLVITRAPFLTAALIPCFIGLAYTASIAGMPLNWFYATLAIVGVALLHLASNMFNDYFDYKSGTDQANTAYFTQYSGGSRSIEMRLIDLKGTRNVALTFAIIALGIGLYLTYAVGQGVLIMGLIGLFCGFFYTAPPFRLVARRGIGELTIGMAFGPLITMGMHYVTTGTYSWDAFYFGIPVGLLTMNILLINQIPDTESDASTGKNHLVVTFGKKAAVFFYTLFFVASLGTTAWLAATYNQPYLYAVIGIGLIYGGWIINYMRQHVLDRTLVKANVQTINMQIVLGILFALAIAFG